MPLKIRSHLFVKAAARIGREPLLQFMLLGALLFAADRQIARGADDPRHIVVDAAQRAELASIFEDTQGRKPSPVEMREQILEWSQNEVLFREAKAMRLDQGDDMIRQRLILKLKSVLFNSVVTGVPTEEELRAWFEARRASYDRPDLFDFEQFQLAELETLEQGERLARELGTSAAPEEYADLVRSYEARPDSNVVALLGQEQAQKVLAAPEGAWVAVTTGQGLRLARRTARRPAAPANFEQLRHKLAREWKDHAQKADLAALLERIASQYRIEVIADPAPALDGARADLASGESRR